MKGQTSKEFPGAASSNNENRGLAFEVKGGKKLKGEITPQGAKNEALQIISAVLALG